MNNMFHGNDVTNLLIKHRSFLMGVAMLSIMLYHQPWRKIGLFKFFEFTGDLGVEIFLFVSGWGIYHSLSKNSLKTYFKNRFLRLMPTCIFIGIIQVLIEQTGFVGGSLNPIAHLMMCLGLFKWYIFAIIVYYLIAPLLHRYLTKGFQMLIFSLIVLLIIIYCKSIRFLDDASNVFLTTLPIIIYRFPAFLFGFWYAHRPLEMSWGSAVIGIISYLVAIMAAYHVWGTDYDSVIKVIAFTISIPALLHCTLWVIDAVENTPLYAVVVWIGTLSLEFYLWHDFFFRGVTSGIFTESVLVQILLSLCLTILFVTLTHKTIRLINIKIKQ